MTDPVFGTDALAQLRAAYPEAPVLIDHDMRDHPLLTFDALADLALSMREVDVEYNRADLPVGIDPDDIEANGLGIVETLRTIETNGSWMVLKFIEQNPRYAALLRETLAQVAPAVNDVTGEMLKLEGFIFVSSPGAMTPFHMDPEHNILLQLKGRKTMTVFPADDDELAPGAAHEAFHAGGHRNLAWRDDFVGRGKAFDLMPGKAIYVPVKAPHFVRNGDAVSVSLSITWRSEWSYRENYARQWNGLVRKAGLEPKSPKRFPAQNHAKSLAWRTVEKAMRVVGR